MVHHAQCVTEKRGLPEGDLWHNPIWHKGPTTLDECSRRCDREKDHRGRRCVAFEWRDGGDPHGPEEKRDCALAWTCDITNPWTGGSVYLAHARMSYRGMYNFKCYHAAGKNCDL